MLDFLSTTDVRRWVPAEEEDAVSEVSDQEAGITTVPSHVGLHGVGGRGQGRGHILSIFISFVISLVRLTSPWDGPGRRAGQRVFTKPS